MKQTLALNWERMIPGHPGPGGRLGTKKDMEQQLAFMTDLSAEVKKASDAAGTSGTSCSIVGSSSDKRVRFPVASPDADRKVASLSGNRSLPFFLRRE